QAATGAPYTTLFRSPERRATMAPTPTSAGTLPSQKAAITSAPSRALPVAAADSANAYSQPHGKRPVETPSSAARPSELVPLEPRSEEHTSELQSREN